MRLTDWAALVTLSILWGGSFFFVGVAVKDTAPLTIVTARVGIASLVLLIVLRLSGGLPSLTRATVAAFMTMGFLNNVVPFFLIVWGQRHIESGLASIFNATMPLFTVVVAHFLTSDEKMTASRLFGVVSGMAGVAVMIGADVFSISFSTLWPQLAILAAALSYAFASIYGRRFARLGVSPVATAAGQVTASTMMLLPVTLFVDQPWNTALPSWSSIAAIVALAVLATALAYILYFRILERAGATNLSLVTFLIPVSAIALGAVFLGEVLLTRHFVGLGLIALGLMAIDGRLAKMVRAR